MDAKDVHAFLNESFRGHVTLARLVDEARQRFLNRKPLRKIANQKPLVAREVDPYVERFVLDVLRVVAMPNVVDALLTVATPEGRLANLTRP
jgi:hypothetical protein